MNLEPIRLRIDSVVNDIEAISQKLEELVGRIQALEDAIAHIRGMQASVKRGSDD